MGTLDNVLIGGTVLGIFAYVTNFMGFKAWADTNLLPPPLPPVEPLPPTEPLPPENPDPQPPIQNDPPPKTGTTFKCVSYPRCDAAVSGTDARKKCCCDNKCAMMKKSNQTMSPTFSGNLCLCNFKTIATPPPKPVPFKCVSYPACNNQSTDAKRKACCCGSKCVAMGYPRGMKEINSQNQCICNRNTTTPTGTSCEPYLTNRCKSICSAHVGTTPYLDSKCSCFCRKTSNVAGVRSYQATRPQEALDDGLMQVPTIA